MIQVTRLNGAKVWVNPHQIEFIETNPDTTLVLLSGKTVIVREKAEEVLEKILNYRSRIGTFKNEL
ncbi:MAG: flagellar FlbD family protein [Treponemataceae bacterium]|nr:flagellar FlbD family protein [Treponemataceae bacterium]